MIECTCEECDECILRLMKCLGADIEDEVEEAADVPTVGFRAADAVAPGAAAAPTVAPAHAGGRGANTPSQSTPPCTQQAQPPPAAGE
jgi:hypothetical protein